jgi:hypothetical protein
MDGSLASLPQIRAAGAGLTAVVPGVWACRIPGDMGRPAELLKRKRTRGRRRLYAYKLSSGRFASLLILHGYATIPRPQNVATENGPSCQRARRQARRPRL